MKALYGTILLALLASTAATANAASSSLNSFPPKVLSVLVQVNAAGHVTDAVPSIRLSPQLTRLLRQNLDELITGPSTAKGHPTTSQFVMNLALQAEPRKDGKYDTHFVYVSTSLVSPGSWYWINVDGRRLALANRDELARVR